MRPFRVTIAAANCGSITFIRQYSHSTLPKAITGFSEVPQEARNSAQTIATAEMLIGEGPDGSAWRFGQRHSTNQMMQASEITPKSTHPPVSGSDHASKFSSVL